MTQNSSIGSEWLETYKSSSGVGGSSGGADINGGDLILIKIT